MVKYSLTNMDSSPVDLDYHIGSKVKSRRSMLGISQDKLGNYLGVTFQQIQKYEKGVNRISASTLYRIADALATDISYFVEGYSGAPCLKDNDLLTYELDNFKKKESVELLKAYYKIDNPTARKKVLEVVKAVAAAVVANSKEN